MSGIWNDTNPIYLSVDNLPWNTYNYTLNIADDFFHNLTSTVMVHIRTNVPPVVSPWTTQPIYQGTIGNSITWNLTGNANYNPTYALYRNGSPLGDSPWSSGQTLNFTIDGLAIGTYNYTLAAFDGINGTTQNQINVTVLARHPSRNYSQCQSHLYLSLAQ